MLLVLTGYYAGEKTLYHALLDAMSSVYVAVGLEGVLMRDLPGYAAAHMHVPNLSEEEEQKLAQAQAAELAVVLKGAHPGHDNNSDSGSKGSPTSSPTS